MLFILLSVIALAAGNPIGTPVLLAPAAVSSASRLDVIQPALKAVAISAPVISTGLIKTPSLVWGNKDIAAPILSSGLSLGSGWSSKGIIPISGGVISPDLSLGSGWGGKSISGGWLGPKIAPVAVAAPVSISAPISLKTPLTLASPIIGLGGASLGGWGDKGLWGGKWN